MNWEPKPLDFADLIAAQNPWLVAGSVPTELAKPIRRQLADVLWRAVDMEPRRYQLVLGPRRVGKTISMYQTVHLLLTRRGVPVERLRWLRLDHPILLDVPLGDLVKSLLAHRACTEEEPLYLFLDEITYAKEWDLWLKTFYDEGWPVRVIATSSAAAALHERRRESGVGRWEEQYLAPWLFTEYLALRGHEVSFQPAPTLKETLAQIIQTPPHLPSALADERQRYLLIGGFPELLTLAADDSTSEVLRSQRVLHDAVERTIYKDIPQVFSIQEPQKLERLLYTLGGQIAGLLSPSSLAGDLGISQPTFDRYLRYLCETFLVFTLPNYSSSEETVQRRRRKLFFVEGAIRNAALQRGLAPLREPAEMGLLVENATAAHLHALARQSGARLFHWRKGKDEVDLVYDDGAAPVAFESTIGSRHSLKGLRAFRKRYRAFDRSCFLVSWSSAALLPEQSPDGIGRIPLDLFLIAVGKQAGAALAKRLPFGSPAERSDAP